MLRIRRADEVNVTARGFALFCSARKRDQPVDASV